MIEKIFAIKVKKGFLLLLGFFILRIKKNDALFFKFFLRNIKPLFFFKVSFLGGALFI